MSGARPVVAVTGANGYVGSILTRALEDRARLVRLVRRPQRAEDIAWTFDMSTAEMSALLQAHGVETLIHAAWDMRAVSRREVQKGSVEGSLRLIDAARAARVARFIFISTISAYDGARSIYGQSKRSVERRAADVGLSLRLGLVYGATSGGMFDKLRTRAEAARVLPLIGTGAAPQYLLDEATLVSVVERACRGDFDQGPKCLTLAHPSPIAFRDLLRTLAGPARRLRLVPLPWRAVHLGLRTAELLGIRLGFRSDSVLSLVHQNRDPDFTGLAASQITIPPFTWPPDGQPANA